MTDNEKDDSRDDVDWLKDAFDRAIQGDNGTAPDAARPAASPFTAPTPVEPPTPVAPPAPPEMLSHRHDLDLDFETDNMPPVTSFEPVVPLENPLPSVATDYPPTEAIDAVDLPVTAVPAAEPPAASNSTVTDETAGIDRLDALFSAADIASVTTADTPTVSSSVPVAKPGIFGKAASRTPREPREPRDRTSNPADQAKFRQRLVMVVGVIVIAIMSIGAFLGGATLATPAAIPAAQPTDTPTAPTALQPPGEYAFDELFGGECIDPFDTAWAATFTVVDCATPHAAQLVYSGDLAVDEAYPSFPGDTHVGNAAMAGCSEQGVLDLAKAKTYRDLLMSAAYPVTSEAWDSGDTRYFCFTNLSSGELLTGSIAGDGVTPGVAPTPEPTASD